MRTVKADFHNHLRTTSRMYKLDFNRTVDRASEELGPGGILGLINFDDFRYEEFTQLPGYDREDYGNSIYIPSKDLLIVKGQEIPTEQGHLLAIGLEKNVNIAPKQSLEETIKITKEQDGIVIADHPFYKDGIGPYLESNHDVIKQIDAIETYNSEACLGIPFIAPFRANAKAQKFYNKIKDDYQNLGQISSSDGHSVSEIGSSYTEIQMPDDYTLMTSQQINNNLRSQIKSSRSETKHKRAKSWVGAVVHGVKLAAITLLGAIGFGRFFRTKKQFIPEN